MKRKICAGAIALIIGMQAPAAYAWKTVYDPQNHKENIATKVQAIKQVEQQAQQLKNELANLEKLDPKNMEKTLNQIKGVVNTVKKLRESVNAIGTSYKDLMAEFDELRPDYENWNGASAIEYAQHIDKIRQAWEKAIEQSMKSQGIASPEEQEKTADTLDRLVDASQNAEGAMGAMQSLTQISALTVTELQKMQVIMADSMRTQNLYYQKQIEAEEQAKKMSEEARKGLQAYKDILFTEGNKELAHYQ